MTYYIYHIPGKKIGMTCDLYNRVTEQQGYEPHEYEVLKKSKNIDQASYLERLLQKSYGYKVDGVPYNKLKFNNMKMKINVTEQTTTFPCPVNKLKGQLMDSVGMKWETEFGDCIITNKSIKWIMNNIKESMYNTERCYVYNKALARYFDNNNAFDLDNAKQMNLVDQYNGKTISGALSPTGTGCSQPDCDNEYSTLFECIRDWANDRGLYDSGDPKTQALKLVEEVGETCKAILKNDKPEIIDGIGDCVVVLTNLAELIGVPIEDCIQTAYNEIKDRTGKMDNGTFKKD